MSEPMTRAAIEPGEIAGWPSLAIVYRTDPERIAELVPAGIEPGPNPHVTISIYQFPVPDEPEYGVRVSVEATYDGVVGNYTLAYGITQEAAVFISRDMNGQPKYPCEVTFYRFGDVVRARCSHQGYTFIEFSGKVAESLPAPGEEDEYQWWIKVSPAVGYKQRQYDFPPHVVRVRSRRGPGPRNRIEGNLTLLDSPWDPINELLPVREVLSTTLEGPRPLLVHEISLGGALDPEAFWPHVFTIGGSRWPGQMGGPRRKS